MALCCLHLAVTSGANAASGSQYAYIGGASGLFEFRVKANGNLQPLRKGPLKGTPYLSQLLIDPKTRAVYGLSVEDKIYSYSIGEMGRLALNATMPFEATSVALDSKNHFLYTLDGGNNVIVYDVLNPKHIFKTQTIKMPTEAQEILVDQSNHSLLVLTKYEAQKGYAAGGRLFRYTLHRRVSHEKGQHFIICQTSYPIAALPNTLELAGRRLVAGNWGSTLTVYDIESCTSLRILSNQPILNADVAHLPSRIVYCPSGSFLYISTYYGAGSARISPPASPIIVCQLTSDGRLYRQKETGKPVPNPRPYLDKTGRFLYVVGEEGTLDTYKIARDGQLTRLGNRLEISTPTGMVFVGER